MEVITIDSKAFKELIAKINVIAKFVVEFQADNSQSVEDDWVDSYEVATFLHVSLRTLQRLRAKNLIPFTELNNQKFYKISDLRRVMEERKIRSSAEYMEDLINNHKLNAQKRRDTTQDQ